MLSLIPGRAGGVGAVSEQRGYLTGLGDAICDSVGTKFSNEKVYLPIDTSSKFLVMIGY